MSENLLRAVGMGEVMFVGAIGLVFKLAPLVLLLVLWRRNNRLQAQVNALEERIMEGRGPLG